MLNSAAITSPITAVMQTNITTLQALDAMTKVKTIFDDNEFHHIPVVNHKNEIVGIISRLDYNRVLSCHMIFNEKRNESYNQNILESLQVGDVMNKNVVTIKNTDGLMKAVDIFKENHFHALPVVNEEEKLVGIVTTFDLLIFAYN